MITSKPVFDHLTALADSTRSRLLLALETHELTVRELQEALQLPQSTVSRHLKVLSDEGWVAARPDGTSHRYRLTPPPTGSSAQRLWGLVREEVGGGQSATRDR
ncbi:MAG: metalloregulator ArsR/SmtB family transcription factor, partial [Gemmatimonadota bacterium]|nr:metalloregulator ArsR/SmtB family transcription factor [Gemmatimonadota bacterium]